MGGGSWVVAVIRLVLSVISLLGYPRGNETAPLAIEKMSRLQSALQLANESERTALEMAEKALEEEAKAKEKERKARAACAKAKEKVMFAEKKQIMWKSACILSWIFFVIVMLLCFGSIEFSGVNRPRLLP